MFVLFFSLLFFLGLDFLVTTLLCLAGQFYGVGEFLFDFSKSIDRRSKNLKSSHTRGFEKC